MATLCERNRGTREHRRAAPTRQRRQEARPEDADDVQYVHHPSFSLPATGEKLWGDGREEIPVPAFRLLPDVEDEEQTPRAARATLSPRQERSLFLQYNYAKYRMKQLAGPPDSDQRRRQWKRWLDRARTVREKIVHANLPLAYAMARRKRAEGVEFADKVAEGYLAILRCVEHFDVSRGFKFSTYACRAILAALGRLGSKTQRYRQHVPVQFDPDLEQDDAAQRRNDQDRADAILSVRLSLARNDAGLDDDQRHVVANRFPIGTDSAARPPWRIGRDLGVSVKRVRQIEKESLRKLAEALMES